MRAGIFTVALLATGCITWGDEGLNVDPTPLLPDYAEVSYSDNDYNTSNSDWEGRGLSGTVGWHLFQQAEADREMANFSETLKSQFKPMALSTLQRDNTQELESKLGEMVGAQRRQTDSLLDALKSLNRSNNALCTEMEEQSRILADLLENTPKREIQEQIQAEIARQGEGYIPWVPKEHETKVEIGTVAAVILTLIKLGVLSPRKPTTPQTASARSEKGPPDATPTEDVEI